MRKSSFRRSFTAVTIGAVTLALLAGVPIHNPSQASSHREAPLILKDPLADNTDVYAFRSTEEGRNGFVTLIANFIPFQEPSGGPNFYPFDDTVLYEIKIDNTGDGVEDISYEFRFNTRLVNPGTISGHAAPNEAFATGNLSKVDPLITSLDDPDYNTPQTYTLTRRDSTGQRTIAEGLITPPNNVGQRSTPNYEEALARRAVYDLPNGGRVFAGQRDEGFYIDIGGVFDTLNLSSITDTGGFDGTAGFNVNTLAIEVPTQALTRSGRMPEGPAASDAVVGVWATASRRRTRVLRQGRTFERGPFVQVSRLANPLVNELVIPVGLKDTFNATTPANDAQFADFVVDPQLPLQIRAVLAAGGISINIPTAPRTDLVSIFATGIPVNPVTGPNYTTFLSDGKPHEMMRLNVAISPTAPGSRSRLGLLGGDVAGFPNGRRVGDDVVDIELRAVLGGTPFTPAFNVAPNNAVGDGVDRNDVAYLDRFPYLGTPHSGNIRGSRPHDHHVPTP